ncbi:MAG: hypothetical protein JO142_05585 [Burkholderiales bacterium]|nr:hypothetical protein [Burkholderiales bacterium]
MASVKRVLLQNVGRSFDILAWFPSDEILSADICKIITPMEEEATTRMMPSLPRDWHSKFPESSHQNDKGHPLLWNRKVLFFFHGWAGLPIFHRLAIERAVLSGYIVISPLHAGSSLVAINEFSNTISADRNPPENPYEQLAWFDEKIDNWSNFSDHVVKYIYQRWDVFCEACKIPVSNHPTFYAAAGFSAGGAVAWNVSQKNDFISAVCNIDGTFCGTQRHARRPIPLLLVCHELTKESGTEMEIMLHLAREHELLHDYDGTHQKIVIKGANHRSFSDLSAASERICGAVSNISQSERYILQASDAILDFFRW